MSRPPRTTLRVASLTTAAEVAEAVPAKDDAAAGAEAAKEGYRRLNSYLGEKLQPVAPPVAVGRARRTPALPFKLRAPPLTWIVPRLGREGAGEHTLVSVRLLRLSRAQALSAPGGCSMRPHSRCTAPMS